MVANQETYIMEQTNSQTDSQTFMEWLVTNSQADTQANMEWLVTGSQTNMEWMVIE